MKYIIIPILFLSIGFSTNAQTKASAIIASKFVQYYNSNVPDSLFEIFSPELQRTVTIEGTKGLVTKISSQLGKINKSLYKGSSDVNIDEYRLSFERPLVDLAIMICDKKITGIFQRPIELDTAGVINKRSLDNYSVKNSYGQINGTLLLPSIKNKVPVVLLISGSGPTDRNMNQGRAVQTNSFLMLADSLSKYGIASVRYDKRGVSKSTTMQKPETVVFSDFITDAELFLKKLKDDPRFSKVIVLGHSEGAAIGINSVLANGADGFISVCGYAKDLGTLMQEQLKNVASDKDYTLFKEVIDSLKADKIVTRELSPALNGMINSQIQPYIKSALKYNSSKEIAQLKIPLLIIGGSTDLQISTNDAVTLAKANHRSKLVIIKDMNHVLKYSSADKMENLKTYNSPESPIPHLLVSEIVKFIDGL